MPNPEPDPTPYPPATDSLTRGSGGWHYAEAERLLEHAQADDYAFVGSHTPELIADRIAAAQVHATLALAAATAYTGLMKPDTYGGRGR